MQEKDIKSNNLVVVSGKIVSEFMYSHETCGEKFFNAQLTVGRRSGAEDIIPIMVSDRLVDVSKKWKGMIVSVNGHFRSYNKCDGEKTKLILHVFVTEFEVSESYERHDTNFIYLDGYICKTPNYRKTQMGREIADLLLAVNRPYGKSDYIPCIVWGRNARFAGQLEVGTRIEIAGRIQSREYQKRISDTKTETRTAYEVSVSKINVIEEKED